ncbi:MAG: hypothetical protein ACFFB3_04105 [Candidatus Hodarchaeota archaeon]
MAKPMKIDVDLWKTGLHGAEIGLRQQEQHRAKSRQFTKDSDIFGRVKVDDKDTGYVAYRKDPWSAELPHQRLIIKLFSDSMAWKGTFEELLGPGLAHTLAVDQPMPVFMANVPKHDPLIRIEKIARVRSVGKKIYGFEILRKEKALEFYKVDAARFSLGKDWDVYDFRDKQIAHVDGKMMDIGGRYEIKFFKEYEPSPPLEDILVMFAASQRFLDDVEDRLMKVAKGIRKGKYTIDLDSDEAALYRNPRRLPV